MIIVQLTGGLGNQLFQYAMGKSLAIRNNCRLKIDLGFFKTYEWHEYSLSPFNIEEFIATSEDIAEMNKAQHSLTSRIKRKLFNSQQVFIHEKDLHYDPAYKRIKSHAYLFGYWQSEEYFKEYEDVIREQLHIKIPPSMQNAETLEQIVSTEAVSLHIRRGNYVAVDSVNKVHGTCSMDYYADAVKKIATVCKRPIFYIFSDDIPWAKANINLAYPCVYIDNNDAKTDYEDLRLMSSCKHHILANSTFSWWGAWLNRSKEKVVIAPNQWFADQTRNAQTEKLIPAGWLKI